MDNKICFSQADILVPVSDLTKWAVIACDQYTSEPEYWYRVKKEISTYPSSFNCILPEAFLSSDNSAKIKQANEKMRDYLNVNLFKQYKNSFVYVKRIQSDGRLRRGLIGKIDLQSYDFSKKNSAAVRATEETVLSRIPPRVEIRKDSPLEIPHIMLLFNDPENELFSTLEENNANYKKIYDFKLMQNAGSISGFKIDRNGEKSVLEILEKISELNNGLLFVVGDGNHSLATAKKCYEQNPGALNRYALVEIVNIHDPALDFEPIFRVLFNIDPENFIEEFSNFCENSGGENEKEFTFIFGDKEIKKKLKIREKLAVAALQPFIDDYLKNHEKANVDYIHDESSVKTLSKKENTLGILFDGMNKTDLFAAVLSDGSLPRKTFSMGHSDDKRFYLEARKIK